MLLLALAQAAVPEPRGGGEANLILPDLDQVTFLAGISGSLLLSAGLAWVGSAFHRLQVVERWARRVTAAVVVAVGLYYTWTFTIQGVSAF